MNLGDQSASGRCPWHLTVRSEFLGIAFIPLRCYNNVAHALARLTPLCLIRPLLLCASLEQPTFHDPPPLGVHIPLLGSAH